MTAETDILKKTKRLLLLRGAIMLLTGAVILPRPGMAVEIVTMFAGAFIIVDAVLTLLTGKGRVRGLFSVLELCCGLLCFFRPFCVDVILVLMIGVWQILGGCSCLLLTFSGIVFSRTWGIVNGVLSILVGLLFVVMPLAGVVAAGWIFGATMLAAGAVALVTAFLLPGGGRTENTGKMEV